MSTDTHTTTGPRIIRLALSAVIAMTLVAATTPLMAQESDLDARGEALVDEFITILTMPDAEKLAGLSDFLAEEFQIVRANGTHMDTAEYLANPATVVEVDVSDVHATEDDGVIVVSYTLSVSETLDGVEQTTTAPRLSVFHEGSDGEWRIAAHANFGALSEPS